jgi:hypothetical protein
MIDEIWNLHFTSLTPTWSVLTLRDCHQCGVKALHITATHVA